MKSNRLMLGGALLGLCLGGIGSVMGQVHEAHDPTPATQPSTAPAKQISPDLAMALLQAGGGIYTSIHEAIDKGDLETAGVLCEDLGKVANEFKAMAAGSPLEVLANVGVKQFERFREAVLAKDLDKAKTIMAGLDRVGQSMSDAIEALRVPATQPH